MPLLINLARETLKLELGTHASVVLRYDELRTGDGESVLARHRNNRWIGDNRQEFATLEILGPLIVSAVTGRAQTLGPYERFSMFDGVGYVEKRVFAFTDIQQHDWYVHDAGAHWPAIKISFHRTGP